MAGMRRKTQTVTSAGEDMEQPRGSEVVAALETLPLLTRGKRVTRSDPATSLLRIPQKTENVRPHETYMSFQAALFTPAEITQVSINRGVIDKMWYVCAHACPRTVSHDEYYSDMKKEALTRATTWMSLEVLSGRSLDANDYRLQDCIYMKIHRQKVD
jgi:hypothetical protein